MNTTTGSLRMAHTLVILAATFALQGCSACRRCFNINNSNAETEVIIAKIIRSETNDAIQNWRHSFANLENSTPLMSPQLARQAMRTRNAFFSFENAMERAKSKDPNADDILNHYDEIVTNWFFFWKRAPLVPAKIIRHSTISCNHTIVMRYTFYFPGDGEDKVYTAFKEKVEIEFVNYRELWLINNISFRTYDLGYPRNETLMQKLGRLENLFLNHSRELQMRAGI